MSEDEADIRKPGSPFAGGETEGHGDRRKHVRRKDGLFTTGEELGYIDSDDAVHKPDGFFFQGDKVAQIEQGTLRDKDGLIFRGEQWGYVDKAGSVWRKGQGFLASDLKIGEVRGDPAQALAFYALKFGDLVQKVEQLEKEADAVRADLQESNKVRARAQGVLEFLPEARALGDFDKLARRLTQLIEAIERRTAENYSKRGQQKKDLVEAVRRLASSSDWRAGGDRIREFQAQWKQIGYAGSEDDRLWNDFRTACDTFYDRRKEFYDRRTNEWDQNLAKLEEICTAAEDLAKRGDTRSGPHTIRELQEQWKAVGPTKREDADKLWRRFRSACDDVFQQAREAKDAREREWEANRRAKEALIDEAQRLSGADDAKYATGRVKELQEEWKEIGHVSREDADDLWKRFRQACDAVFEHAREERERRNVEWRARQLEALRVKREQVTRLEESIEHDAGNIQRWQSTLYSLRPGGRADEIAADLERRIADVQARIHDKRSRIDHLERSIDEIESRLSSS